MSKQITVFEFNKELDTKANVKNLITAKGALEKALKEVKMLESIYSDEMREYKNAMHITRAGEIIFIEDMDNEHLLNTVKLFIRGGMSYKNAGLKKYINEVKKRGLVADILDVRGQSLDEEDDIILDDNEDEEEFAF